MHLLLYVGMFVRMLSVLFAGRMLSAVVGNVADSFYKPFARTPWLTVYRAHAGFSAGVVLAGS